MKKFIYLAALSMLPLPSTAQEEIPVVYLNKDVSTHFISKLNIEYSDLSTQNVVGDLPLANILRIKPKEEAGSLGFVTIIGENFFRQFKLIYEPDMDRAHKHIRLDDPGTFTYPGQGTTAINDGGTIPGNGNYNHPKYTMSHEELRQYALRLYEEKPSLNNVVSKDHFMKLKLNNIWVKDDYIFIDYTAHNKSNIPYTVDEIRYKVVDEKLVKATNSQDVPITPNFTSNERAFLDKKLRNIVAFRKFTFPEDKVLTIEIAEKQYSGRKMILSIKYSDLLHARLLEPSVEKEPEPTAVKETK